MRPERDCPFDGSFGGVVGTVTVDVRQPTDLQAKFKQKLDVPDVVHMSQGSPTDVAKLAAGRKVLVRKKLKSESHNERFLRATSEGEDNGGSPPDSARSEPVAHGDVKTRKKRGSRSHHTDDARRPVTEDEGNYHPVSDTEFVSRSGDLGLASIPEGRAIAHHGSLGRRWTISADGDNADDLPDGIVKATTLPSLVTSGSMPAVNTSPAAAPVTRHNRAVSDSAPRGVSGPNLSPRGESKDKPVDANSARHLRALMLMEKMRAQRSELLSWVREEVKPYGITINGLESLSDGVVFLALLNNYDPTLINYEEFDKSDPHRTLEAALSIAEECLGIPNLLDVDSVIYDHRSLLLYLAHFKTRIDDKKRESNPIAPVQHIAQDVKLFVARQIESVKSLQQQFDQEMLRLAALSTQDEMEAEKAYYQQKAESSHRTIEASRQLVGKLEERNGVLRSQNELLTEKVAMLEKLLEHERAAKKRLEEEFVLTEKIRALASLLEEPELDLSEYLERHQAEIEPLRPKKALASSANMVSSPPQADKSS